MIELQARYVARTREGKRLGGALRCWAWAIWNAPSIAGGRIEVVNFGRNPDPAFRNLRGKLAATAWFEFNFRRDP